MIKNHYHQLLDWEMYLMVEKQDFAKQLQLLVHVL